MGGFSPFLLCILCLFYMFSFHWNIIIFGLKICLTKTIAFLSTDGDLVEFKFVLVVKTPVGFLLVCSSRGRSVLGLLVMLLGSHFRHGMPGVCFLLGIWWSRPLLGTRFAGVTGDRHYQQGKSSCIKTVLWMPFRCTVSTSGEAPPPSPFCSLHKCDLQLIWTQPGPVSTFAS